jgi:hypothetical protein
MNQPANIYDLKKSATELRKAGKFPEAKEIYSSLWTQTKDVYDGAGLLHCLRKLDLDEDAIQLAEELESKCNMLDWCRNEVIWTYTSNILQKFSDEATLDEVLPVAKKIMNLHPDGLATKLVVFKVLKTAKKDNKWDVINEWVLKIEPASLSDKPMIDERGKEGWCDQSLWYNYRLNGLFEIEHYNDVISISEEAIKKFSKEKKYFLRLKAKALNKLGNPEAITIYTELCKHPRADWYMIKEYADIKKESGLLNEAYEQMCRAAQQCPKFDMMVSFYHDFGMLAKELKRNEEAYCYLLLSKLVREENSWKVPPEIINTLDELKLNLNIESIPTDIHSLHQRCKSYWGNNNQNEDQVYRGKVQLGPKEKPFCFISVSKNESYFCFKSDLPIGVKDGDPVSFKRIASFDKKKNTQSWKAINISIIKQ